MNGQIELPSEFDQLFSNVTTSDVTPAALSRYIQQALEHQARLSILSRLTVGFQRPGDPSVKPDDFDGSIASSLVALSSSRVVMVNQKGGHRVKQRRATTQHHRKIEMQRVVRHDGDHWCFLKKNKKNTPTNKNGSIISVSEIDCVIFQDLRNTIESHVLDETAEHPLKEWYVCTRACA